MAEQDFSEIARLSERYNKDPKSRIFVQLADAYRKNNMIEEALEILNKGLEHHPRYPLAHLILGKCHLSRRQFAQARESFEKTLSFDSQNVVALRMLAQTCESMKDEAGQISALKGLLALDPFDTSAKEKMEQLEALQKKEPLYTVSMAQEYEKQGDLKKALSVYEHLLFTDPTDLLLQQKVKELKGKSGEDKRKIEEEKIAELQVDSYFQIDDLKQKEAPIIEPASEPLEATAAKEPPQAPVKEKPPVKEEVTPAPPKEQKPAQEEQILPLEDFLITETPTPPAPEAKEGAPVVETEKAPPPPKETPAPPAPEPAEKVEFKLAEKPEAPTVTPAPAPVEKTETPPPPKETPAPPAPEPAEKVEFKLAEEPEAPAVTPAPAPVEKTEAPPLPKEAPAAPAPEITETPAEQTGPQPLIEETTAPAEQAEEKKEEASKPKEEDFQSFKDWLSGLLK